MTVAITIVATLVTLNLRGGEKKIEHDIPKLYSARDPQFLRAMGILLGPTVVDGNRAQVLLNGDEIFPAMLAAIRSAQKTICFETYIYWSGTIGKEFAEALSRKARAGVKVHVLLDWIGSAKMESAYLDEMREAGVEIEKYHKPAWYTLARLNNRTHRKVLVVDGRVAFTGGVGIADEWSGHAQDPDHWRDTHFRIEGPVVTQMQAVFMDNWIKVSRQVLHGEAYFPPLAASGGSLAQMFSSSPTGGSGETMEIMYLLAITASQHSIDLAIAYFVPDRLAIDALKRAMKRGVRLRIITPGKHSDSETVRRAGRATWGELLEAGAEIYEYQPTMYHVKVMVIDDYMVSVGSTNFDTRSFRLNDEANLNIYDERFAQRLTAIFEEDLKHARKVTLERWRARPVTEKLWEEAAGLLGAQL